MFQDMSSQGKVDHSGVTLHTSYYWFNALYYRRTRYWRCICIADSLGLGHMWLKGSHLMKLHAEIKHLTIQFQQSSLSLEDVLFLIYHCDGIWYEWSRALNVLCIQRRTWLRHLMSRWVLVFYGRVLAGHWQPYPQRTNLYKSRGIKRGSCATLVIYAFINARKELWLGLFGSGPLLWNSQPEYNTAAKVGITSKLTHFCRKLFLSFLSFFLTPF